jgi:hypothetical protein
MSQSTLALLQRTLLATLIAASLVGCHDDDEDEITPEVPKATQTLRGEVTLVNPVANSDLKVLSGSTQIANGKTFANGNFSLSTTPVTAQPLERLRIELQACSDKLNALSCTILSSALDPKKLSGVAQVSIRSTLVDRLQRKSNLSLADAEKRISTYLGLFEAVTSQDAVNTNLFNPAHFVSAHLIEANKTGISLDQQINKTVDQIAADPTLQHSYKPLLGLNPLVKFVGTELIKGAISKIGGEAAGKALSFLGLGAEFEQSQRHAEVMNQLNGINTQLKQITGQINEVQVGVKETLRKIELIDQKLETVAQAQRIQRLLTQTTALVDYVEQVKVTLFDIQNAHQLNSALQPNERKRLKAAIETLLAKRTVLSSTLDGTAGNPSLIANLVEVKFPQPLTVDPIKITFFGPDTINAIQDVVKYYDEINTMSYYLFMEYYNALDQENNVAAQDCPEVLPASGSINRQCTLYHELKSARASYLSLGPQESLPISNMFILVPEIYKKSNLPLVFYPVGDFSNIQFNRNTGTAPQVLARLTEPNYMQLDPTARNEMLNLATWEYVTGPYWFGVFMRPAEGGKSINTAAVANGAPASAFVTANAQYSWWINYGDTTNDWQQRSTKKDFVVNPNDNAKFAVMGKLKNMDEVEKYMGKVIASRFQ